MKRTLLITVMLLASIFSYSQFIHKIKADSVLITNDSCNAELNLENSTKDTLGFLYNTGKGRTQFKKGLIKINDSTYIIGSDTLKIVPTNGNYRAISSLTYALNANTINNANYTQEWQWNSLAGTNGLKLSSTSTAAASNLQRLFNVSLSGTNTTAAQTTVAGYFSNTHTGASSTNIAIEAIATGGATSNFAGRFTGDIYMNGTNPGISFYLGTLASNDYYIRRNGTGLVLNSASYQTLASGLDIYRYNPSDGHTWYTGVSSTTIKAILKQNGNFLIGTTTDGGAKLQVLGTTSLGGDVSTTGDVKIDPTKKLYLDGGSNTYIHESSADVISFVRGGTATVEIISGALRPVTNGVTSLGQLGRGWTTAVFTDSIMSPKIIGGASTVQPIIYRTTTANAGTGSDHIFQVGNNGATEAMRILNNANIGIGTNNPGYKLEVNGDGYFKNKLSFDATNTSSGTTGNQTINKPSGTVNIAAAGTAVTVTNSLVTANSIVYAVLRTNDATAYIKNVVPAAGSFTINLGAAATNEVSIGFVVFN